MAALVTWQSCTPCVCHNDSHMKSHDSHMTVVTWQVPFPDLYSRKVHILLPLEDIKLVSVKHTATLVQKGQSLLPFSLQLSPLFLNPRPHFLQGFLTSCPKRKPLLYLMARPFLKGTICPLRPLVCLLGHLALKEEPGVSSHMTKVHIVHGW